VASSGPTSTPSPPPLSLSPPRQFDFPRGSIRIAGSDAKAIASLPDAGRTTHFVAARIQRKVAKTQRVAKSVQET
jgi:hypothetical protein